MPEKCDASAVVCREGFGPVAEAITRGRRMKTAVELATAISLLASALGVLLMFFLNITGAHESISVSNAFIYMLALFIPAYVLTWFS